MQELQLAFITNPMIHRWMRILTNMEQIGNFTLVQLSEQMVISHRTLVKDIQSIRDYFGDSISLHSDNTGFYFKECDRVSYKEKKEQLIVNEPLFEIMSAIFYGEAIDLDELAHRYSYGESTLRRFFARVRPTLKEYGLALQATPVLLTGDEGSIRKFFFDFYYIAEPTPHTIRPPEGLHQSVIKGLADRLGKYEVGTGLSISAFYSLLYLVVIRVQQGKTISVPKEIKERVYKEKDFELLTLLVPIIEKDYGVTLPKEELAWLHLIIVSKRTIDRLDQEILFLERFNLWPNMADVAVAYFSDPIFDRWDRKVLETFLTSFLVSRKLNDAIYPTWNKQQKETINAIQQEQPITYNKNLTFLEHHQKSMAFSSKSFEEIAVSFTLFSDLLLRYYQPVRKVLFLLEGDYIGIQKIRLQALRILGNQHELIFVSLHELSEEWLKSEETDLIVTNYRPYLFDYGLQNDYILLNTLPTAADWQRVVHALNPLVE
ncbi:helix-turn-helix domain-containing protein [Enterococcus mundtii]|uniref:helix-turn-helix domain-containing protein n=1 Tax=Enterococcus mundtii TaxID=53346 RepID=UPI003219815F